MLRAGVLCLALAGTSEAFGPSAVPLLRQKGDALRVASSRCRSEALAGGLSMAARKPFIAGNWKMNPVTVDEARTLASAVAQEAGSSPADVAVFVPHVFLPVVADGIKGSNVELGAQNMYTQSKGAFTGAVAGSMVQSVGAKHVLIGHSERRSLFGASDEFINQQVHKALADGLKPLLCIGETKDEYEAGLNTMVCAMQLSKGLKGVTKEQMMQVTIAYEPVWAIGTGLVCDADIAQGVHSFIRGWIEKMFGSEVADAIRIQYGGSVTPDSVDELMSKPDIDGCLVGGASLDPKKFARIMNFQVTPNKNPLGGEPGGLRDKLWTAFSGSK